LTLRLKHDNELKFTKWLPGMANCTYRNVSWPPVLTVWNYGVLDMILLLLTNYFPTNCTLTKMAIWYQVTSSFLALIDI